MKLTFGMLLNRMQNLANQNPEIKDMDCRITFNIDNIEYEEALSDTALSANEFILIGDSFERPDRERLAGGYRSKSEMKRVEHMKRAKGEE